MVVTSTTAPASAAAHTIIGEANSPLVRATAIHPSPQLMASAGAMRPPVTRAKTTPMTTTTASTTTVTSCQPPNLRNPVVPISAAVLAVVATQTQPKYSPNVPSVTSLSVGRVETLAESNLMRCT